MEKHILGIHHVTAIAGDPQRNIDFYAGVLGLRLVKLTVNFDDPTTYHLYYGDEVGRPGSILTFFPWPDAPRGRLGSGQLSTTSFSIPDGSMAFWMDRFRDHGVLFEGPTRRFGEEVLSFSDRDGLRLELVQHDFADEGVGWREGPVPGEHAVRGFYSVTLTEEAFGVTASLLTGTLGFRRIGDEGGRVRYEVGDGGPGGFVDVVSSPNVPRGFVSVGTVHHVAWRTGDDEQQKAWREEIVRKGLRVTPIIDRKYFHSIYFREPGGVLFEIATDSPGFTVDESREELGSGLVLPTWLEPERARIEKALPTIHPPKTVPAQ